MANANQEDVINMHLDLLTAAASYRIVAFLNARVHIERLLRSPDFEYSRTIGAVGSIHETLDSLLETGKNMNLEAQKVLGEVASQILPRDCGEPPGYKSEFYYFAKEHPLAVSGLAYHVANKLKDDPELSKRLRDYYEAYARGLLEKADKKADDTQKVVIYATGSVTETIAAERYAQASTFEKGMIELYFPEIGKPGFKNHLRHFLQMHKNYERVPIAK